MTFIRKYKTYQTFNDQQLRMSIKKENKHLLKSDENIYSYKKNNKLHWTSSGSGGSSKRRTYTERSYRAFELMRGYKVQWLHFATNVFWLENVSHFFKKFFCRKNSLIIKKHHLINPKMFFFLFEELARVSTVPAFPSRYISFYLMLKHIGRSSRGRKCD